MNDQSPFEIYLNFTTSLDQFGKLPEDLTPAEQKKLASFIDTQLTLHKAVISSPTAAGIGVSGKQIDHALNELKQRFPDQDAFIKTLDHHGLTEKTLTQALKETLQRENILDTVTRDIPPLSNELAESYYFKNLDKFKQPERRQASHILITINEEFKDNQRANTIARIQEIFDQAHPQNFEQLAMRHSECPTAMNHGKLGLVSKAQLHPELDEALFNMTANSISEPIETEAGMHILWCASIEPAHRVEFGEAKERILAMHHRRAVISAKKQWIQTLLNPQVA